MPWTPAVRRSLIFLAATFCGVVFIALGQPGLPEYFSYDARKIQAIAANENYVINDQNFESVAHLYRILNLDNDAVVAGVTTFLIYCTVCFIVLSRTAPSASPLYETAALLGTIFLGAVYLGQYTKDLLPALTYLPLVLSRTNALRWRLVFVLSAVVYAAFFREYWFLVLMLTLALWAVNRTRARAGLSTMVILAFWVGLSLALPALVGVDIGHYREVANSDRLASADATTAIPSFVPGDGPVEGVANVLASFVFLQVPVPLFLIGTVYHATLAILIGSLWFGFWRALVRGSGQGAQALRLAPIIVAFVAVQAVFEPDFGSALRHLTPLIPAMLFVMSTAAPDSEVNHAGAGGIGHSGSLGAHRRRSSIRERVG
ncbi:hypothetical protein G6553_11850 [Nocardioides sp. IC4_145]|uniref:hypothetical protein n=1 Tax=Nocardioides sp. IC4_145 TaxID=2714037 RepID=UPI00140A5148|nr:hypothetical protein [Nocardioides sp. IC4_145]NHC23863.1 hypothetical protein [Nocardioides sp. IC4_145]